MTVLLMDTPDYNICEHIQTSVAYVGDCLAPHFCLRNSTRVQDCNAVSVWSYQRITASILDDDVDSQINVVLGCSQEKALVAVIGTLVRV